MKTKTVKTFSGLGWVVAGHSFNELAKEYGSSVSAASFDRWCAKSIPSSLYNSKEWHNRDSITGFLGEFENGNEMLRRLLAFANAYHKGKRASSDAYTASNPAKKKGSSTPRRAEILAAFGIADKEQAIAEIRREQREQLLEKVEEFLSLDE